MRRRAPLIVALLAALACTVTAGAPLLTGPARAGAAVRQTPAATNDGGTGRTFEMDRDRIHCLQIVANLRAQPPQTPVVILLGGSSAREATVADADWAAEIQRIGGPQVLAYNLGSRHDTYALDREVAELLPEDLPGIVFIGINVGRFCSSPSEPSMTLPEPQFPPANYYPHVYSIRKGILSASLKRGRVEHWLTTRWPEFTARYSYNIRVVESLVRICKARGLHPVLVDLPRDMPIIGHDFDVPLAKYKAGCQRVATKYDIPWLTFVAAANFVDRDFFDLFHLVEPGRVKYQSLLSKKTARLLAKYGFQNPVPPEPTPTPSPSPTPTDPPAPAPTPTATQAPAS